MEQAEARAVFQDILKSLVDKTAIQAYSVDKTAGGYLLRLIGTMDEDAVDCIAPILAKHNLGMKKERGVTVIYSL